MIKIINLDNNNQHYFKAEDVKKRLFNQYNYNKANLLYSTWLKLSFEGEEEVKKYMSSSTFYRHRKELIENCCNWNNNIIEKEVNILSEFTPYFNSSYNFNKENQLEYLYKEYNVS